MMNGDAKLQRRLNAKTQRQWQSYHSHRTRVMGLLRAAVAQPERGRLCILGAGNCNDVDLVACTALFAQVVLVDLDEQAVERGLQQQKLTANQLRQIEVLRCDLLRPLDPSLGGFSVVLSSCVLSQLINEALRQKCPPASWLAVRRSHLLSMATLTEPGGSCLLVSDFVSSDTAPALSTCSESMLAALAVNLIQQNNFFHCLNPIAVHGSFASDAVLSSMVRPLEGPHFWKWSISAQRHYLVSAWHLSRVH